MSRHTELRKSLRSPRFRYRLMIMNKLLIAVFPAIDTVVAYKTKAAYRRVNSGQVRQNLLKRAAELYRVE